MPGLEKNKKLDEFDKKEISYKNLDENFPENLLGIYESWKEVPSKYWILLNKKYWDIRILINVFSNHLTTSEMENPKPSFPHDPYTRRNFTPAELHTFKKTCKDLHLKIYIGLAKFLEANIEEIYKQEYGTSTEMANLIIGTLSSNLRYKIINNKNSQDCYTGYWVLSNYKQSNFEKLYKLYNSMPFQVCIYNYGNYYITENIDKINVKKIIECIKEENIDLNSDDICVYL